MYGRWVFVWLIFLRFLIIKFEKKHTSSFPTFSHVCQITIISKLVRFSRNRWRKISYKVSVTWERSRYLEWQTFRFSSLMRDFTFLSTSLIKLFIWVLDALTFKPWKSSFKQGIFKNMCFSYRLISMQNANKIWQGKYPSVITNSDYSFMKVHAVFFWMQHSQFLLQYYPLCSQEKIFFQYLTIEST